MRKRCFPVIPKFKNTNEALTFGKEANPQQIIQLQKLRKRALNIANRYITKGKYQQALNIACIAQFYREAIEANETQNI